MKMLKALKARRPRNGVEQSRSRGVEKRDGKTARLQDG
jgi:hypothetical protein